MRATGLGSFPGEDQRDFDEAVAIVLGELGSDAHGLPFLPEVPFRGAHAGMVGRTLGLVTELDADLQPGGWRLTGTSGAPPLDQRRARSLLAQDLDALEERAVGHDGDFKVQVAGPWTLASWVERPRGDRLLADHGARRDLAQALAAGVADHVRDLRRRLPAVDRLVVQVDGAIPAAVLEGGVPTASGFGRHRVVHPPEASEALAWLVEAVRDAGAEVWAHDCGPTPPVDLIRGAGVTGVHVDLSLATPEVHDQLATALEAGDTVLLGVVPSLDPDPVPGVGQVAQQVLRWLDMVGLDPALHADRVLVAPTCGHAGATAAWTRQALELSRAAAQALDG
ncbi:MAG TPA: methionine synthase [Nocardioides sp.]|nr:methionine synthase [Nocardioides sp.]